MKCISYKSLEDIIDVVRESVEVTKPVYNFKASDDDVPWKKKNEV